MSINSEADDSYIFGGEDELEDILHGFEIDYDADSDSDCQNSEVDMEFIPEGWYPPADNAMPGLELEEIGGLNFNINPDPELDPTGFDHEIIVPNAVSDAEYHSEHPRVRTAIDEVYLNLAQVEHPDLYNTVTVDVINVRELVDRLIRAFLPQFWRYRERDPEMNRPFAVKNPRPHHQAMLETCVNCGFRFHKQPLYGCPASERHEVRRIMAAAVVAKLTDATNNANNPNNSNSSSTENFKIVEDIEDTEHSELSEDTEDVGDVVNTAVTENAVNMENTTAPRSNRRAPWRERRSISAIEISQLRRVSSSSSFSSSSSIQPNISSLTEVELDAILNNNRRDPEYDGNLDYIGIKEEGHSDKCQVHSQLPISSTRTRKNTKLHFGWEVVIGHDHSSLPTFPRPPPSPPSATPQLLRQHYTRYYPARSLFAAFTHLLPRGVTFSQNQIRKLFAYFLLHPWFDCDLQALTLRAAYRELWALFLIRDEDDVPTQDDISKYRQQETAALRERRRRLQLERLSPSQQQQRSLDALQQNQQGYGKQQPLEEQLRQQQERQQQKTQQSKASVSFNPALTELLRLRSLEQRFTTHFNMALLANNVIYETRDQNASERTRAASQARNGWVLGGAALMQRAINGGVHSGTGEQQHDINANTEASPGSGGTRRMKNILKTCQYIAFPTSEYNPHEGQLASSFSPPLSPLPLRTAPPSVNAGSKRQRPSSSGSCSEPQARRRRESLRCAPTRTAVAATSQAHPMGQVLYSHTLPLFQNTDLTRPDEPNALEALGRRLQDLFRRAHVRRMALGLVLPEYTTQHKTREERQAESRARAKERRRQEVISTRNSRRGSTMQEPAQLETIEVDPGSTADGALNSQSTSGGTMAEHDAAQQLIAMSSVQGFARPTTQALGARELPDESQQLRNLLDAAMEVGVLPLQSIISNNGATGASTTGQLQQMLFENNAPAPLVSSQLYGHGDMYTQPLQMLADVADMDRSFAVAQTQTTIFGSSVSGSLSADQSRPMVFGNNALGSLPAGPMYDQGHQFLDVLATAAAYVPYQLNPISLKGIENMNQNGTELFNLVPMLGSTLPSPCPAQNHVMMGQAEPAVDQMTTAYAQLTGPTMTDVVTNSGAQNADVINEDFVADLLHDDPQVNYFDILDEPIEGFRRWDMQQQTNRNNRALITDISLFHEQ